MNKTYIFLAAVMVLLGLGLFVLESDSIQEETPARQLLRELSDNTRYITSDQLAERIINGDPTIQMIDVRDPYDFMDFALPGAENIPLSDILLEESLEIMSREGKDFIFYSTGDVFANQAWMLARRNGLQNVYVLDGGLNRWIATIIKPVMPASTQAQEAFDLYQFRKGASQYFTGGGAKVENNTQHEQVNFTRKKKKAVIEGGC